MKNIRIEPTFTVAKHHHINRIYYYPTYASTQLLFQAQNQYIQGNETRRQDAFFQKQFLFDGRKADHYERAVSKLPKRPKWENNRIVREFLETTDSSNLAE